MRNRLARWNQKRENILDINREYHAADSLNKGSNKMTLKTQSILAIICIDFEFKSALVRQWSNCDELDNDSWWNTLHRCQSLETSSILSPLLGELTLCLLLDNATLSIHLCHHPKVILLTFILRSHSLLRKSIWFHFIWEEIKFLRQHLPTSSITFLDWQWNTFSLRKSLSLRSKSTVTHSESVTFRNLASFIYFNRRSSCPTRASSWHRNAKHGFSSRKKWRRSRLCDMSLFRWQHNDTPIVQDEDDAETQ